MNSIAYYFLLHSLLSLHGKESLLSISVGKDFKGKISTVIYIVGIGLSFLNAWMGVALYAVVAMIWFIPDKRIERKEIIESENTDGKK